MCDAVAGTKVSLHESQPMRAMRTMTGGIAGLLLGAAAAFGCAGTAATSGAPVAPAAGVSAEEEKDHVWRRRDRAQEGSATSPKQTPKSEGK